MRYIDLYEDGTCCLSITRKLNAINDENLNHNCIDSCFNKNVLYRQAHSREGLYNKLILPMVLMASMLTYSHQTKLALANCWVTMLHWSIKVIHCAPVHIHLGMQACSFLCKRSVKPPTPAFWPLFGMSDLVCHCSEWAPGQQPGIEIIYDISMLSSDPVWVMSAESHRNLRLWHRLQLNSCSWNTVGGLCKDTRSKHSSQIISSIHFCTDCYNNTKDAYL